MAEVLPPRRTGTVLKWGFTRRCAVCGAGHLFRHWIQMDSHCPRCGHRFLREPGHWVGSWFLNLCVVQAIAVLYLIVAVGISWPESVPVVVAVGGLLVTLAWALFFFPFSRTIWCAIDLAMKPLEFTEDVAPGFELEAEIDAFLTEVAARPSSASPPSPSSPPAPGDAEPSA